MFGVAAGSAAVWLGALVVGVTLGLLGSGGSILTVPLLIYLVEQPEKVAVLCSLCFALELLALNMRQAAASITNENRASWIRPGIKPATKAPA